MRCDAWESVRMGGLFGRGFLGRSEVGLMRLSSGLLATDGDEFHEHRAGRGHNFWAGAASLIPRASSLPFSRGLR